MMSERDFFGTIPTQIALGNHDLELFKSGWNYSIHDDDESIEIAQGYENRFHMPQIRPPIKELASLKGFTIDGQPKDFVQYEYGNAYYSFTFGPSKHIVLSSFSSFREGSLQYDWLLSELKSVNRSITPWLIVMLHCPVYTTFKTHHKEMFVTEAQVILEPLFVDYTVNFVIAGHIHAYMRTHPMAFSRRNPRGPIHIIQIAQGYENRFHMPQIRPPIKELASLKGFTIDGQPKDFVQYEYGNAYYSFTFGPSKHIVLSSFSSFREGSLQYDWLLSELKSVNRSITPWLIVMLHCPVYTTFKTHHKEMFVTEAQVILEPLFVDYTVNFVIAGHIHAYMRTHPMAFSRRNPRGPIHIIQGNGGKGVGQKYNNETAEEWVAMRDQSQYGYGTLELFNNTHAMWRWIKTGYDENGEFEPDLNLHDEILVMNQLYAEEIRGAANEDWEDNV